MNLKYFKSKSACVFLAFIFSLQSCNVYKRAPITIDEAVTAQKKVKVRTNDDKKIILKRIEKTDSIYYGVARIRGELVKIPMKEDQIQKIRVIDKGGSIAVSILTTLGILGVIAIAILASAWESFNVDLESQ